MPHFGLSPAVTSHSQDKNRTRIRKKNRKLGPEKGQDMCVEGVGGQGGRCGGNPQPSNLSLPCPQRSWWVWSPSRVPCPPRPQRKPSRRAGRMCKAPGAPWRRRTRRRRDSALHWSSWGRPGSWASESVLARLPVSPSALCPPACCLSVSPACLFPGRVPRPGLAQSFLLSCNYCVPGRISHRICISGGSSQGCPHHRHSRVYTRTQPHVHTPAGHTSPAQAQTPAGVKAPRRGMPCLCKTTGASGGFLPCRVGWGVPASASALPRPAPAGSGQLRRSGPGCSVSDPNCWAPSRTF